MLLLAGLCVLAAGFAAASWWLYSTNRLSAASVAGYTIVFVWLAGAGAKIHLDRATETDDVQQLLNAMESATRTQVDRASVPSASMANSVAPVESLIEGLEARLEAEPDDAKGWALLAQSYSFLGNSDAAERAVARAVELGFAESDLRNRVEKARRDMYPPLSEGRDIRG